MMNERARELGLTGSHFTNATGLPDPKMHVTARDLARLARHIIRTYPDHYKIYSEPSFTWNKIQQRNRNPLLGMDIGADGLKTGYTNEAGYGLVGSAVQKGLRIIVVVSGLKTSKQRASEGHKLLEWGFNSFESRVLFAEGQRIADARVFGGATNYVALTGPGAVRLMMPRRSDESVTARVVYTGPVEAPVRRGRPIGTLRVWRGDLLVLEVPLAGPRGRGEREHVAAGDGCGRPNWPSACSGPACRGFTRHANRGASSPSRAARGPVSPPMRRTLAERLRGLGREVVLTREPGGSPGAEIMRHVLLSGAARPFGPEAEARPVCCRPRRSPQHDDPAGA